VTQATKHHGAELELDPLRHAEPMKFVAENVSQTPDRIAINTRQSN